MAKNGNGKRFKLQSLALTLALAAPFALFWALENNLAVLASIFFAVIAASMVLTLRAG